jgi:methionine-S-sulfoxide reductase
VIRTRVGYAGGEKANPTYRDLGNHSEAIQIDFDPALITYDDLLDVFWESHNPTRPSWSLQYASFVFTHDAEQSSKAEASAAALGQEVATVIKPLDRFWRAEDYHQKYRLRNSRGVMEVLDPFYATDREFVDSTVAARLNGLLAGYGTHDVVRAEFEKLEAPADVLALLDR